MVQACRREDGIVLDSMSSRVAPGRCGFNFCPGIEVGRLPSLGLKIAFRFDSELVLHDDGTFACIFWTYSATNLLTPTLGNPRSIFDDLGNQQGLYREHIGFSVGKG